MINATATGSGTPTTLVADTTPPAAPVSPPVPVIDNTVIPSEIKPPANVPAKFPDEWRQLLANNDDKELQRLNRFADLGSVYKAYRELEGKLSSGNFKQPLPADPTPEQVAQYRKDNGIPDTSAGYELKLEGGITVGEEDKPIVGYMMDVFHQQNMSPKAVNQIIEGWYKAKETEAGVLAEQQQSIRAASEETLRSEWGGNYAMNLNAVKGLLGSLPGGIGTDLIQAKLPDGSVLGNNADALRAFANLAFELNPAGTVVPGSTGNQVQAIDQELASLNELMAKDIRAWHKNMPAKQRHRDLLDAKGKLAAKGF